MIAISYGGGWGVNGKELYKILSGMSEGELKSNLYMGVSNNPDTTVLTQTINVLVPIKRMWYWYTNVNLRTYVVFNSLYGSVASSLTGDTVFSNLRVWENKHGDIDCWDVIVYEESLCAGIPVRIYEVCGVEFNQDVYDKRDRIIVKVRDRVQDMV